MSPWDFQNKVKELIMRKTIISALALLSLTACVQEEMVSVNQGDAIAFDNAFVEMATRAESITRDNLTGFNVWGFINDPTTPIFESTEVKKEENSGWSYDGTQYWIPGHDYYFAAIAPMNSQNWSVATKDENNVCMGNTYGPGLLNFKNVDGSEDLIYSTTHVVAAEIGQSHPVSFNFKHILSKVKFTFANHMGNDYIDVKVSNITLKAPKEATMNLANESLVWTPGSEKESYYFGTLEIAAKDSESSEDLFLIPSIVSIPYEISFDLELLMDGVDGTQEVLYHASKNATIAGNALEIGTAYNFSTAINPDILNLDTIEFTVDDVEDWDEASDLSKIVIASKLGGEVTLAENVRIPDSEIIEVTRNLTINLNGKTLSYNGDNRMFKIVDGATLTINGNDIETSSVVVESDNLNEATTAAYIATAYAESKIVINGGTHTTNGCTTYHTNGGTVEINSGSFAATEEGYTPAGKYGHKYTLNIQGTDGNIIVRGGSFYKYDPSHSEGENPAANFLESELTAVPEGDWYVVKEPAKEVIAYDAKSFKDALNKNAQSIIFNNDIDCSDEPITIPNDLVINMNNKLFTGYNAKGGAPSIGVNGGYDVILKNANIKGNGLYAYFGAYLEFESGEFDINFNKDVTGNNGFYAVSDRNSTSIIRIKDGEFNLVGNKANSYITAQGNAIVYIEGGTFGAAGTRTVINTSSYDGNTGQVIITGGTFGFDPSNWVADEYEAIYDSSTKTWTVKKISE